MSKITDVKILYRHPDPNVRKLPAKPLEFKNHEGKTEFYLAVMVDTAKGPQAFYSVPLDYARRLLANQPDRYFLAEPSELVVKRKLAGGLSSEMVVVTNKVAAKFLTADGDAVAAKAKAEEEARLQAEADRKARAEEKARAEAEEKAKAKEEEERAAREEAARKAKADEQAQADADALAALEAAPIPGANALPEGNPPEIL